MNEIKSPKSEQSLPQPLAIERLLATGKSMSEPIRVSGMRPSVIIPPDYQLIPLNFETDPPLPDHIKQTVSCGDAASFIKYVTDFKGPNTRIFFDCPSLAELVEGKGNASFTALLDYHEQPEKLPDRVGHRVIYKCPCSIEWMTWIRASGKAMLQAAFIDFIEANVPDIAQPPAADLMEMALNFEAATDARFASKVDRVTGGRCLTFTEDITATANMNGQKIKVPDAMILSIPVFEGGAFFEIHARISYDPKSGKLSITVHLLRPHLALRAALATLRMDIEAGLGLPVLFGVAS